MEKKYFDCATNIYERGVVYDELTAENLCKWFKDSKGKFPIRIMGENDFYGKIRKDEDGVKYLVLYRWVNHTSSNEWVLNIGKTITKNKWFGITRFIEDYLDGVLDKDYAWNSEHIIKLA